MDRYAQKKWIPEFRDANTEREFRQSRIEYDKRLGLLFVAVGAFLFLGFYIADSRNFAGSGPLEQGHLLAIRCVPLLVLAIVSLLVWRSNHVQRVFVGIGIAIAAQPAAYFAFVAVSAASGGTPAWSIFFPLSCFHSMLMANASARSCAALGLFSTTLAVIASNLTGDMDAARLKLFSFTMALAISAAIIIVFAVQRNARRHYTALRLAEDQRRQTAKELAEVEQQVHMNVFKANVAHDLNNYLTPVVGITDVLRNRLDDESPDQVLAQEANDAAVRAKEVAQRLLDREEGNVERVPVSVYHSINAIGDYLQDVAGDAALNIRLPVEDTNLLSQPQAFERVLINLVMNAGEAVLPGRGEIEVSLDRVPSPQSSPKKDYLRIMVRDNGSGIDPKVINRVFEPHITTKPSGHGLGLASVRQIVEEHEGTVAAHNGDTGAVFEVLWPIASNDQRRASEIVSRPGAG